jgi:hypothetical protein
MHDVTCHNLVEVRNVFSSFRQPVVCGAFTGRMLAARQGLLSVKPLTHQLYNFLQMYE